MYAVSPAAVTGTAYPAVGSPQIAAPAGSTDDYVLIMAVAGDADAMISFDGTNDHVYVGKSTLPGCNAVKVPCGPGAKLYVKRVGGATVTVAATYMTGGA